MVKEVRVDRHKEAPEWRGGRVGLCEPDRGKCQGGGSDQASHATASGSNSTRPGWLMVDLGFSIVGWQRMEESEKRQETVGVAGPLGVSAVQWSPEMQPLWVDVGAEAFNFYGERMCVYRSG